jgi:ABC-type bacteriocin/lantibiotic exporter with double-glycine peptidase domain
VTDKLFAIIGLLFLHQKEIKNKKNDVKLPIVGLRQTMSYTCGFVATYTCLSFLKKIDKNDLFKKLNPTEDGLSETKMIKVIRKEGFVCGVVKNPTYNKVCSIIDEGHSIICSNQWDEHWICIIGYNKNKKQVLIAGDTPRRQTWKDFRYGDGGATGTCIVPSLKTEII